MIRPRILLVLLAAAGMAAVAMTTASAHGDVTPQPIDTTGLDALKEGEWLTENPYRDNATAVSIGESGYSQNCARCHGLQAISGGLAPDLRYLEKAKPGDEWFIDRVRHGAKKPDGSTMMPAFEGVISQEGMWAIRAYLESVHTE